MKSRLLMSGLMACAIAGVCPLFSAGQAPAPAAAGAPAAPGRGGAGAARGGRGGGRGGSPATPEDLAETAKLMNLPAYGPGKPDGDYSVGPDYKPAPELTPREGVAKGKVIEFTMDSAESKFYKGTNGTFKRAVEVYVPAGYVAGTPLPFIYAADQYGFLDGNYLPTILDNMIADKRLPPMGAIMIQNSNPTGDRSIEYDTVSAKYGQYVEEEVLPRVEKEAGVTLTKDPDGRMTFGGSSGGAVALTMAWFYPDRYHKVLSYSGTFVNLRSGPDAPHGAYEYPEHFFPDNPPRNLRIWIHASEKDNGATTGSAGMRNWVIANERLAATLKAKGYHYQFVFAKDGTHTDLRVRKETLPDALEFVWKGYPIPGK